MIKMLKKILSFLMILILISGYSQAFSEGSVKVFLNGNEISFDQPPVIKDDRTLVPVRAVCEALGADVYWNDSITDTQIILIIKNEIKLFMECSASYLTRFIGFSIDYLREYGYTEDFWMEVPPEIINNRALLPIRAVCEALGVLVEWDEDGRNINLSCPNYYIENVNKDKTFADEVFNYIKEFREAEPTPQRPAKNPGEFTVYSALVSTFPYNNFGDSDIFKELEKRTGVKIEYIHAPAGHEVEKFNLMMAANALADISITNITNANTQRYTRDSMYDLTPYLENAPNIKALLKNPDIYRDVVAEDGKIYGIPTIYKEPLTEFQGLAIRSDWLDELNLSVPTTIDELYTVLKEFKENKNTNIPFTGASASNWLRRLAYSYGVSDTFFDDNQAVKFGPATQKYKEFLTEMKKWYDEGLISSEYAAIDTKAVDYNVINGDSGVVFGSASAINEYITEGIPLIPLNFLKTEALHVSPRKTYIYNMRAYIAQSCQYPEQAIKWLDYLYSEEGSNLLNYGIEGMTYNMVDGKPQYTELITSNPDGFAPIPALQANTVQSFAFLCDGKRNFEINGTNEIIDAWNNIEETTLEPLPSHMQAYGYVKGTTEIQVYSDEMTLKFIYGSENLEKFDVFVGVLEHLGLENAVASYQENLDIYYTH